MAAGVYDFIAEQGVNHSFQVQYKNPDKTGKNLTNWEAIGQVKAKLNDCEPLGNLDIHFAEPSKGILLVTLKKETIADLKVRGTNHKDYITLVYDIKLWPANEPDKSVRLLNGTIKISPEVSKNG